MSRKNSRDASKFDLTLASTVARKATISDERERRTTDRAILDHITNPTDAGDDDDDDDEIEMIPERTKGKITKANADWMNTRQAIFADVAPVGTKGRGEVIAKIELTQLESKTVRNAGQSHYMATRILERTARLDAENSSPKPKRTKIIDDTRPDFADIVPINFPELVTRVHTDAAMAAMNPPMTFPMNFVGDMHKIYNIAHESIVEEMTNATLSPTEMERQMKLADQQADTAQLLMEAQYQAHREWIRVRFDTQRIITTPHTDAFAEATALYQLSGSLTALPKNAGHEARQALAKTLVSLDKSTTDSASAMESRADYEKIMANDTIENDPVFAGTPAGKNFKTWLGSQSRVARMLKEYHQEIARYEGYRGTVHEKFGGAPGKSIPPEKPNMVDVALIRGVFIKYTEQATNRNLSDEQKKHLSGDSISNDTTKNSGRIADVEPISITRFMFFLREVPPDEDVPLCMNGENCTIYHLSQPERGSIVPASKPKTPVVNGLAEIASTQQNIAHVDQHSSNITYRRGSTRGFIGRAYLTSKEMAAYTSSSQAKKIFNRRRCVVCHMAKVLFYYRKEEDEHRPDTVRTDPKNYFQIGSDWGDLGDKLCFQSKNTPTPGGTKNKSSRIIGKFPIFQVDHFRHSHTVDETTTKQKKGLDTIIYLPLANFRQSSAQ